MKASASSQGGQGALPLLSSLPLSPSFLQTHTHILRFWGAALLVWSCFFFLFPPSLLHLALDSVFPGDSFCITLTLLFPFSPSIYDASICHYYDGLSLSLSSLSVIVLSLLLTGCFSHQLDRFLSISCFLYFASFIFLCVCFWYFLLPWLVFLWLFVFLRSLWGL